jgi:hypothetical protein
MLDQTILTWSAAIIAVGGAVGILWKLLKPLCDRVHAFMDELDKFMRDWAGEPASPGRSAVPGVMERLNRMDGELKRNGGSSMKDALNRVEQTQKQIIERLDEGNLRFGSIEQKISDMNRKGD